MAENFGVDAPRVTRDQALELMVHHLQLAAMYFEAAPDDHHICINEMKRLLTHDERAFVGAMPWYNALATFYDEMEDRD